MSPTGRNTDQETVKMFSQVEISTRMKLFDLFRIDFELFEYSADKYLQ